MVGRADPTPERGSVPSLAITNIGTLVSGDLERGVLLADTVVCQDGKISRIGSGLDLAGVDVVLDARGTTVAPGLIDSHCHVGLVHYTLRHNTADLLDC